MYTGKNPTAIRSQQWLSDALLALMRERPYSEINVKDICAYSDLSRQTFYQLFKSKEELVRYSIRQRFLPLNQVLTQMDFMKMSEYLISYISKNKEYIDLIYKNHLGFLLASELSEVLNIVADRIDPDRDPKTKKIANAYITAALTNTLLVWSQTNELSEKELFVLICRILKGEYYKIF